MKPGFQPGRLTQPFLRHEPLGRNPIIIFKGGIPVKKFLSLLLCALLNSALAEAKTLALPKGLKRAKDFFVFSWNNADVP